MNKFSKFEIKGIDGKIIKAYKMEPKNPIANFHLVHGLSEYVERYEHFANFLFKNNISIFSLDNRGFGKTIDKPKNIGLVKKGDVQQIVNDHIELTKILKSNSKLPTIIFGHSFGSFITQKYIQLYNKDQLVILSGTTGKTNMVVLGRIITRILMLFGKHRRSSKISSLIVGNKSKTLPNPKTPVDWLSRDDKVIKDYLEDEYCNKVLPISWYNQMFKLMLPKNLYKKSNLKKINKEVPIYLFSGDNDPVGNNGIRVKQLSKMYKSLNIKTIDVKLYPGGRHEMINEINKEEVYKDILKKIKNSI